MTDSRNEMRVPDGTAAPTSATALWALPLVLLTLLVVALRLYLSANVVNLWVNYTIEAGAFYEKFHFGTYAMLGLAFIALGSRPLVFGPGDAPRFRALFRFGLLMIGLFGLLLIAGSGRTPAPFIDTYFCAALAGLVLLAQNPSARRLVAECVVALNVASAVLATIEAVLKVHVLPYPTVEEVFRPVGLMEHPLTLGLVSAGTIGFVVLTSWRGWVKALAIALLFIGAAASGARFALLVASLELVALLLFVPWTRMPPRLARKAKLSSLALLLALGLLLFAALATGGLLSRFSNGIVDANAFARIDIYRVFGMVSPGEILFGTDLNDLMALVNKRLHLPFIESSIVYLTFQMGLLLLLIFVFALWRLLRRLLASQPIAASIATLTFFVAALSNNTFSTKTPVVTMVIVLLIGLARAPRPAPSEPQTPPPEPQNKIEAQII